MTAARREAATSPHTHPLYDDPSLRYVRVQSAGDEPAPEPGVVDVAVLDMNHGYANLGHSSIVESLLTIANAERQAIGAAAPGFRVVSFDVRGHAAVPALAGWRYPIVVGTGGPGSLDPRENDGVAEFSQGIQEDPRWEAPLFRLFDRILADESTALLAICHSFGILARWSGFARPELRPRVKGGKSAGVVTNVLTPGAHAHPWFRGLWEEVGGDRIQVLDSRLYDLVPTGSNGFLPLAHEESGEALTMVELARGADGVTPRIWGVNHHPEIGDRGRQAARLARLESRGEVTHEWVDERRAALEAWNASAATEKRLQATAEYTFEAPLRRLVALALK
ncbi:MAG TPA: hypothetical protein VKF32_02545 [Thermoanaerobaculia bacterium]|nr:hypothetical protein [Thermoanaerobaculia bacterium]